MTIKNKNLKEIFEGEEFSKDFQEKINDIFETAVKDAVKEKEHEVKAKMEADMEAEMEKKIEELEAANEKYKDEVVLENVEKYLSAAIDEWYDENKVAVQEGLVVEMANDFLQSATKLVESNGFKVDKKEIDINKDLKEEVETLKQDQNKIIESNISLKKQNAEMLKESKAKNVLSTLELTESQIEKVSPAVSKLSYKNEDQFETAVKSIVESYFPKTEEKEPVVIKEEQEQKINDAYLENLLKGI